MKTGNRSTRATVLACVFSLLVAGLLVAGCGSSSDGEQSKKQQGMTPDTRSYVAYGDELVPGDIDNAVALLRRDAEIRQCLSKAKGDAEWPAPCTDTKWVGSVLAQFNDCQAPNIAARCVGYEITAWPDGGVVGTNSTDPLVLERLYVEDEGVVFRRASITANIARIGNVWRVYFDSIIVGQATQLRKVTEVDSHTGRVEQAEVIRTIKG